MNAYLMKEQMNEKMNVHQWTIITTVSEGSMWIEWMNEWMGNGRC